MKKYLHFIVLAPVCLALLAPCALTQTPEVKAKVEAKAKQLQALGTDPKVVAAVKAYNSAVPPEAAAMTNDKWKGLTQLDPAVRVYTRNPLAVYLKTRMDPAVSEWFVSASGGTKVAFMFKPTSWTHSGKDKHQIPMSGKLFYGPVEMDESSGQRQIQVGIPVIDGGRAIGTIVAGIAVSKL